MTFEQAVRDAIETAEFMIEESLEKLAVIREEGSDDGNGYEYGWNQGRKDACRVLLIGLRMAS